MLEIRLTGKNAYNSFCRTLKDNITELCELGTAVKVNELTGENKNYYNIGFDAELQFMPILKNRLANLVAEHILQYNAWHYLVRRVRHLCPELSGAEYGAIIKQSAQFVKDLSNPEIDMMSLSFAPQLTAKMLEQFESCGFVDTEGFFRFSMHDTVDAIEKSVGYAVEEFLAEREYHDFILLLQELLQHTLVRELKVHVLLKDSGSFALYDENGMYIPDKDDDYYDIYSPLGKDFKGLDEVLGRLINLAPFDVYVHAPHGLPGHIVQPLADIWGDQLHFCHGCELCLPH